MAKYMITFHLDGTARNEAIKRFVSTGGAPPPEGLTELGRWHSVATDGGYSVVETDDPKAIADWILQWSDLLSYDVDPVIMDEELSELFEKHGLG